MKPLNRFVVINIKDHEVEVVLNTWIQMEDDPPTYRRPADQIQFCEAIMNEIEPEKNWEKIPFSRDLKSFNSRDHNVTPLSPVSNAIKRHIASLHRNWDQTDSGLSKWFVEQQKAGRFVGMKNPWDPNKKGQKTSTTSTSKKTGKRTKGLEKIVSSSESEDEKSVQEEEESDSDLPAPPKKLKVTDASFDSDTSSQNTNSHENNDKQSTEGFDTSSPNTNDLDNNRKQSTEDENSLMISINEVGLRTNHKKIASIEYRLGKIERKLASASSSDLSVSSSAPSSSFSRMNEYLPAKDKEQMKIVEDKLENEPEFVSNVASNSLNLYSFNHHDQVHSIPFDISLGREVSDCCNPNLVIDSFISNNILTDIYTDGSKVSGAPSVGSAFCCPATGREYAASYDPLTSVFSAECHAINAALDYIQSEAVGRNYIILSDSLSALQSLQSANLGVKSNHALFEIKSKFIAWHKNNRGFSIRLAWIPSHIGIRGNERADALARAATGIDPGVYPRVAFTDLVASFKRTAAENTTAASLRDAEVKGVRFFASFHNSNRATPWFRDKALDRFHIVTVNRMRSDHHSLAESLHRKNIVADPGCRCGLATESLNHAIWQCDLYDRHRGALWRALSGLGLRRPLNIESIIAAPNIQACVAVCDFLRRCSLRV
ncbi:hypothetical protein TKK_0000311 [Trichogramma kaykai]